MPKVSKVGKFRQTAVADAARRSQLSMSDAGSNSALPSSSSSNATTLSRGQRKRQAKREQYLKRQKMVLSTLKLKREEEQRNRIDGLDALKDSIMGVSKTLESHSTEPLANSSGDNSKALASNKAKRKLTATEVQHMGLVLEHPSFQADPFATIREHLTNTLKNDADVMQKESEERAKAEEQRKAKLKEIRKERKREMGGKKRKKFKAARKTR